jgi:hypothetical protein
MLAIVLASASIGLALAGEPPPGPTAEAIRAGVTRALPLLEKGSAGYVAQRDCFSCHHQAVPSFALDLARRRGFEVDADNLAEQTELTHSDLSSALDSYKKGEGQGGGVTRAGYALWMLALGGHEADEVTGAVAGYILGREPERGHWRTSSNRPPSESSPFTTTFVALRGLQAFSPAPEKVRLDERTAKVRAWLEATEPNDNEERVFRLWGLKLAGAASDRVAVASEQLRARQRPDGGWAQLDDGTSDAYATGSALVALNLGGGVATDDPTYLRGLAYLLADQREDGSWHVVSRSKPFQPYFESGFPHGKDQFVSMAASGWATAALALACPVPQTPEMP